MFYLRRGFTLLEMSIVLVIIAVVLGGGAVIFSASLQKRQYDETQAKLAVIQKLLLDYRRVFNRLPCPANLLAYNVGAQYFGIEAQNPGTCDGTPAASYTASPYGHAIYVGMVPTKSLKLPDEYAFDGWGRRIVYAVDGPFTQTSAFVNDATISDITYDVTNAVIRLTIRTTGNNDKTIHAAYVLLSHGPNGHGAIGRLGGTPITTGMTNPYELGNCNCQTSGTHNGGTDAIFWQSPLTEDPDNPQNLFDDIVVYATRTDLRSAAE